jgi:hypothetical protein
MKNKELTQSYKKAFAELRLTQSITEKYLCGLL